MHHPVKLFGAIAIAALIFPAFSKAGASQILSFVGSNGENKIAAGVHPSMRLRDEEESQEQREERLRQSRLRLEDQLELCEGTQPCTAQAEIVKELSDV